MTLASDDIYHRGIVRSIEDGKIHVSVETHGECKACSVKSSCGISDNDEKFVSVKAEAGNFQIGEEVELVYNKYLVLKSAFLVYVLPIAIGLVCMFLLHAVFNNELLTGLSMITAFVLYFLALKGFNKPISTTFSFTVSKISDKSTSKK